MNKIVEQKWDYTKHAKFYEYRPNYAKESIAMLKTMVEMAKKDGMLVADIGAGTGNLSLMLLELNLKVDAVEPNDAMREIGIQRTQGMDVVWHRALGTETGLDSKKYDWVAFGSSFNVMDRSVALKEAYRLLKKDGWFSCMWNHRDLNDPIQKEVENIIKEFVPTYNGGVRREDQRPVLEQHRDLFDGIVYLEQDFYFNQTIDTYIYAWQSVKNPYWDLETDEGRELFDSITNKIRITLPSEFRIKYTTRSWSAKKV